MRLSCSRTRLYVNLVSTLGNGTACCGLARPYFCEAAPELDWDGEGDCFYDSWDSDLGASYKPLGRRCEGYKVIQE